MTRRRALLAAAMTATAASRAAAVVGRGRRRHAAASGIHITAYFTESNGIYAGNHVDILGLASRHV